MPANPRPVKPRLRPHQALAPGRPPGTLPPMIRLRCGVILTDSFLVWLRQWTAVEGTSHEGRVLALEYVRCRDGPRAGQAWLEWMWVKRAGLSSHCLFRIPDGAIENEAAAPIDLYLSPQSQTGLRWRHLAASHGQPTVG